MDLALTQRAGAILGAVGILVNNYAFLHDLLVKGEGEIIMGPASWALAAAGIVITCIGLGIMHRAES